MGFVANIVIILLLQPLDGTSVRAKQKTEIIEVPRNSYFTNFIGKFFDPLFGTSIRAKRKAEIIEVPRNSFFTNFVGKYFDPLFGVPLVTKVIKDSHQSEIPPKNETSKEVTDKEPRTEINISEHHTSTDLKTKLLKVRQTEEK